MVALLLILLYYSLSYWTIHYPSHLPIKEIMFYVSLGIAIVTTISWWIEGRIKVIMKTVAEIKKGKMEVRYG